MTLLRVGIDTLVLLNCAVTIAVLFSRVLERSQKFYQTLIIWLLPVVAAVLYAVLLREPSGRGASMNRPDIGLTPGMDGNVFKGDDSTVGRDVVPAALDRWLSMLGLHPSLRATGRPIPPARTTRTFSSWA